MTSDSAFLIILGAQEWLGLVRRTLRGAGITMFEPILTSCRCTFEEPAGPIRSGQRDQNGIQSTWCVVLRPFEYYVNRCLPVCGERVLKTVSPLYSI